MKTGPKKPRFPKWMRRPVAHGAGISSTQKILDDLKLATVCHGAKCPNIGECFARRTATFMILGTVCTRCCTFCNIGGKESKPEPVKADEPERVAEAAARMKLKHVVITSVTRDDLPDGGASHFARCVELVRSGGKSVEVLTPDFKGNNSSIETVATSGPDVYNHNVETVPRLYSAVRPGADYIKSLELIRHVKEEFPDIITKSGLMVGLGESNEEINAVMDDLRESGCDVITVGQYLAPGGKHAPVERFVTPREFSDFESAAIRKGFLAAACGPYVRSSYNAAYVLESAGMTRPAGSEAQDGKDA